MSLPLAPSTLARQGRCAWCAARCLPERRIEHRGILFCGQLCVFDYLTLYLLVPNAQAHAILEELG
jgi:hypothetical protein